MPQDNEVLLHQAQISTNYVRILLAKLSQKNSVDIDSFLAGRNLDKALLVRQDGMLPMSTFLLLMEEAAATTHDPCLGLHYYEDIDFKDLGIFGYALLNSESLGDALALSCRYYCLFQSDMKITLSTSGDRAQVAYQITARNLPYSRQDSEMTIMAIAMVVRRLIDDNWRPEAVYFQHPAPADTSEHRRLLCSNLHFDHPLNKIVFHKSLLQAPVANGDTKLSHSLEATLEQLLTLRQLPSENDWLKALQDHIIDALSDGAPAIEDIAQHMHMSGRTLQRKLHKEEMTFKDVVENVRHQLACNYLRVSSLSLLDIAFLLGYSELSSFNRAFKRWTGVSPLEYRKPHQVRG